MDSPYNTVLGVKHVSLVCLAAVHRKQFQKEHFYQEGSSDVKLALSIPRLNHHVSRNPNPALQTGWSLHMHWWCCFQFHLPDLTIIVYWPSNYTNLITLKIRFCRALTHSSPVLVLSITATITSKALNGFHQHNTFVNIIIITSFYYQQLEAAPSTVNLA